MSPKVPTRQAVHPAEDEQDLQLAAGGLHLRSGQGIMMISITNNNITNAIYPTDREPHHHADQAEAGHCSYLGREVRAAWIHQVSTSNSIYNIYTISTPLSTISTRYLPQLWVHAGRSVPALPLAQHGLAALRRRELRRHGEHRTRELSDLKIFGMNKNI